MDISLVSRENEAFISRLKGAVSRFESKGLVTQIGFLDELTCRLAKRYFAEIGFQAFSFLYLRSDSSRLFLSVGTYFDDEVDFAYICVRPDKFHKPAHGDYMGALMALQIDRKLFGDLIVTESSDAFLVVWNKGNIVDYLIDNYNSCGKAKLTLKLIDSEKYDSLELQFIRTELIVSSLRADCIVASIANTSRSQSKHLIERGEFKLFSSSVEDPDYNVSVGDVFSLRGFGKYRFESIIGSTKRERVRIELLKFGNYIERKDSHDSTS